MSAAFGELLTAAIRQLTAISATPRLDAEVLLAAALGCSRAHLLAWPEQTPTPQALADFSAALERRCAGEPVAYILGRREFWSLDLVVTAAVLIPRPETELLVELALARLPPGRPLAVADLGTGSGAIALALATERPQARVVATDRSRSALKVACHNATRLGLANIIWREGDWCTPLAGERFDLIVANPPYVATSDPHWRTGELRFEPPEALIAGADGLDALRTLIAKAPEHLLPEGWLLLEHGYDQGEATTALLRERGFIAVTDYRDVAGLSRCASGRWPG